MGIGENAESTWNADEVRNQKKDRGAQQSKTQPLAAVQERGSNEAGILFYLHEHSIPKSL